MKTLGDMVQQYDRGRYSFSDFLGLAEQSDFHEQIREYDALPWELFGGTDNCERVMLRIGDEETLGYTEPWPIRTLMVSPKNQKFADPLTHRDFLGAILHLGLERDTIGDIFIEDNVGYVFCTEQVAPYLVQNLDRVKHTSVVCREIEELPELERTKPEEKFIQTSSLRIDLVVAKVYNLSRSAAQELFPARKIYVDGRLCENNSRELEPGEMVSVRGFGRMSLKEERGLSRKGKHNLVMEVTPR